MTQFYVSKQHKIELFVMIIRITYVKNEKKLQKAFVTAYKE